MDAQIHAMVALLDVIVAVKVVVTEPVEMDVLMDV